MTIEGSQGRPANASHDTLAVTEIRGLVQLPDPKTEFSVKFGDYAMQFYPIKPSISCRRPGGVNSNSYPLVPRNWYVFRISFVEGSIVFTIDQKELVKVPAQGKRDGIIIEVKGSGGSGGKVVLDNLLIRREQ